MTGLSEITAKIKASQPNRAGKYIERAIVAAVDAALDPYQKGVAAAVAARHSGDRITPALVTKGAVVPASTTAPAWAGNTSVAVVGDFVLSLQDMSAGARLFNAAPHVGLDGINTITFPLRDGTIAANDVSWVEQAGPIAVKKYPLATGATLGPTKKLCAIVVCTRELANGSAAAVLPHMVREAVSFGLDSRLFSDEAATTAAPAGLLNGVAALTATTGGGSDALIADLEQLSYAISPVTSRLAFIAHTAQANAIKLRMGSIFSSDIPVWGTTGVAPGTVIALDPAALVSGFGPEPEITASISATLHMEDTSPLALAESSPPSRAAPLRSLFQTDTISIRTVLRCAWCWRTPGAVAWLADATWGGAPAS